MKISLLPILYVLTLFLSSLIYFTNSSEARYKGSNFFDFSTPCPIDSQSYFKENEVSLEIETLMSIDEQYVVPIVIDKAHPEIAFRINQSIQNFLFEKYLSKKDRLNLKQFLLDNEFLFLVDKEHFTGFIGCNFKVMANTERLLSIEITTDYLSAYPTTNTHLFSFDPSTGMEINATDFLTEKGVNQITSIAVNFFEKAIEEKKEQLFQEGYSDIYESLISCIPDRNGVGIMITADGFLIERGACLPHVTAALDLKWTYSVPFNVMSDAALTSKGDSFIHGVKVKNSNKKGLFLEGRIDDQYPFIMDLNIRQDHSIDGYYLYARMGKKIILKGFKVSEEELVLEEGEWLMTLYLDRDTSKEITAVSGTWQKKENISPMNIKKISFQSTRAY